MRPVVVHITRQPDDPIALRISAGGNDVVGFYVVYRGNPDEIIRCMEECLAAMKKLREARAAG